MPFFYHLFVSSAPVGHSQHLHNQPALLSDPEFMTFLLLSVFSVVCILGYFTVRNPVGKINDIKFYVIQGFGLIICEIGKSSSNTKVKIFEVSAQEPKLHFN